MFLIRLTKGDGQIKALESSCVEVKGQLWLFTSLLFVVYFHVLVLWYACVSLGLFLCSYYKHDRLLVSLLCFFFLSCVSGLGFWACMCAHAWCMCTHTCSVRTHMQTTRMRTHTRAQKPKFSSSLFLFAFFHIFSLYLGLFPMFRSWSQ